MVQKVRWKMKGLFESIHLYLSVMYTIWIYNLTCRDVVLAMGNFFNAVKYTVKLSILLEMIKMRMKKVQEKRLVFGCRVIFIVIWYKSICSLLSRHQFPLNSRTNLRTIEKISCRRQKNKILLWKQYLHQKTSSWNTWVAIANS